MSSSHTSTDALSQVSRSHASPGTKHLATAEQGDQLNAGRLLQHPDAPRSRLKA